MTHDIIIAFKLDIKTNTSLEDDILSQKIAFDDVKSLVADVQEHMTKMKGYKCNTAVLRSVNVEEIKGLSL